VIVDLPGAQSPLLATAVGLSNHVIIPVQGSTMDAQGRCWNCCAISTIVQASKSRTRCCCHA
jgi:hypothetical protein